jgi:hypothetical protein
VDDVLLLLPSSTVLEAPEKEIPKPKPVEVDDVDDVLPPKPVELDDVDDDEEPPQSMSSWASQFAPRRHALWALTQLHLPSESKSGASWQALKVKAQLNFATSSQSCGQPAGTSEKSDGH